MSDSLSQVMLEFSANFESFDAALSQAEQRASRAGKNIERSLHVKNKTSGGDKSVVTGKVPTQASTNNYVNKITVDNRNVTSTLSKESAATRSSFANYLSAQTQAIQSGFRDQVNATKSSSGSSLKNRTLDTIGNYTVRPALDALSRGIGSILDPFIADFGSALSIQGDAMAIEIGAFFKATKDPMVNAIADAFLEGSSTGLEQLSREVARTLAESLGIVQADKTTLNRSAKLPVQGNTSAREFVAYKTDAKNIEKQIKEVSKALSTAKAQLTKFEKTGNVTGLVQEREDRTRANRSLGVEKETAKLTQASASDSLLATEEKVRAVLANRKDFSQADVDSVRAEYNQALADKKAADSAVIKANNDLISNKQALVKLERNALIKEYDQRVKAIADKQEDVSVLQTRFNRTVDAGEGALNQTNKQSSADLMRARDELRAAYESSKQDLLSKGVGQESLNNLDVLKSKKGGYEEKLDKNKATLASRKQKTSELSAAVFAAQTPEDVAKAQKALDKYRSGTKRTVAALKKNQKAYDLLEDAIAEQISVLAQSGFSGLQKQTELLGQELLVVEKTLRARAAKKLPPLVQDVLKGLNVSVQDLDNVPTIKSATPEQLVKRGAVPGAQGLYDSDDNTVYLTPEIRKEIDKGINEASVASVELLTHELVHAVQTNFGKISTSDILSGAAAPKKIIKENSITNDELRVISPALKGYAGKNTNEQRLEREAYIAAKRAADKQKRRLIAGSSGDLLDAGKTGILQLNKKVRGDILPKLDKTSDTYKELYDMFNQEILDLVTYIKAEQADFNSVGQAQIDLNVDAVYDKLKHNLDAITDFQERSTALVEKADKKIKENDLKTRIKSRLGNTVSGFKGSFSTETKTFSGAGNLALSGGKAIGGALLDASKDVYQLATVAESAALTLLPFGQQIKTTTQALALMGATVGVAAAIPGGTQVAGLLLEGAQAVLAPAIDLAASGLGAAVGGTVEAAVSGTAGIITGAIAESGVAGAAMIAGALTSASASIAGAAGAGVGAAVTGGAGLALTAGAVAVPTVAATKAVAGGLNSLNGSKESRAYGKAVGQAAQAYLAESKLVKEKLKALAPAKGADQKALSSSYSKQVKLLQGQIEAADEALVSTKGDNAAMKLITATRKNLAAMLKTRLDTAKVKGISVEAVIDMPDQDEPKMKKIRQVNNLDEAVNAGKKGAKMASEGYKKAKDFKDGFAQTLDTDTDFWGSAEDAAKRALKGFAKGQDSASPSKKTKKLARDFAQGFQNGIDADQGFAESTKKAAGRAVDAFDKTLAADIDKIEIDTALDKLKDSLGLDADQDPVAELKVRMVADSEDLQRGVDQELADMKAGKPLQTYNKYSKPSERVELEVDVDMGRVADNLANEIKKGEVKITFTQKIKAELQNSGANLKLAARKLGSKVTEAYNDGLAITGAAAPDFESSEARIALLSAQVDQHINELEKAEKIISEMEGEVGAPKPQINTGNRRVDRIVQGAVSGDAETLGTAVGEGAGVAYNQLKDLLGLSVNTAPFKKFFAAFDAGFKTTGKGAFKLKTALVSVGAFAGFMLLRRQITSFGKAMFDAQLNSEVLSKKLNTVNLGGVNPFQKFGADAKAAGLSVQDYGNAYAGMVSTMGKSLPNADKVFKDLTKGLNVRGVVGESSTRALEALQQISSKGTVSMEELRQQLGEALPGALSIAADSMGMTSGEFNKLVESGGLAASDFLPKFSRQLNAVAGSDLPSLNGELVAAKSNIQGLLTAGGKDLPFTKALELFNGTVVAGSAIIQPMVTILSVALPAALLGTAFAALKAATAIKLVSSTLKFGGTVGLTVAALAVVIASVSHLSKEFGGLERSGAKARESLRNPIKASIELDGDVKSVSIFNKIYDALNKGRPAAERELRDMKNEFSKDANAIFDATLDSGSLLKPEIIEKTKKDLEGLVAAQKANASELGNADTLGYTSDQKKALLAEADRIQDAINERINLSLGDPAKINASLANVASKTAAIMQDGAARGLTEEATKVAYAGQLSILTKTGAMLKEQLRIHAAITESVNQQAIARKEMNTALELGTSVVDKKGVADTLAAYKELEGVTSTLAGFESRSMVIDIKTKEGSVDSITNQIETIDAFLATATASQSKVLSENFANGVKNATDKEIIDFKMRIEKGGFDYDAGVVEMVNALQKRSDLTRDLNQSNIDLIKANRELANALLDFEDARIGLEIKGNQAEIDFTTQANDLKKESDPARNKEVIGANRELFDFGLQQEDSVRNMSVGFRSFTDSLNDAAYSLKDSIRNMSVEMKAVAIQMQQNSLNGINTFISAAGINDQLGLTKLLDAVSESVGIEGSNKKESILAEKANEERSTDRQVRDFSEQRDGLNREADRAITELSRKIQDLDLDAIDIEVQAELSTEQIEIKSAQAEQQSRDLIRSASEFDDRALGFGQASLDIDKGGILDAYNKLQDALNLAAENPLAVQQALYDYNRAMKEEATKVLGAIQDVKATGNANIGNKITEVQTLGKEKSDLYSAQAAQEDARVAQELEINARKIEGVIVSIKKAIKAGTNDIISQTGVLVNGVYEQFAQYGLTTLNPYEKIEKDLTKWGRATKSELENQKREYKELLNLLGEGGSTGDNTINILAEVESSSLPEERKDQLRSEIANIRSTEDYVKLLDVVRRAISDLDGGLSQLSDNKLAELVDQAKAIQKAKDLLTRDNTLTTETAGLLESQDTSRLSRKDERKLQLEKASRKISQDFENKKAQIAEDARNQPNLYGGAIALERENMALEEKNNLLKKAQKEASILSEIYAGMSSAGVDAIKTAILGVGEALLSNQPKEDAQRELQDDYANRLSDLVNNFEGSAEELQLAKDNLDGQRDDIQAEIDTKLSKTAQIFDVLKGALSGFAQSIAQVAAQMAASAAIKGIAGALGGGGGFGGMIGGLIGNAKDGAHVTAGISNYSMGGEVGSAISLKNGIDTAMRREGAGAVPVVVSQGEQILSKRNGDAQLYRSLKAQGDWDNIKRANIGNYVNGGTIGNPGTSSRLRGMGGGNSYSNTQVTIVAPNPESFHKSRSVIQREVQSSQERVSRRGLA